jgi:hypothetical protein
MKLSTKKSMHVLVLKLFIHNLVMFFSVHKIAHILFLLIYLFMI